MNSDIPNPPSAVHFFNCAKEYMHQLGFDLDPSLNEYLALHGKILRCTQKMLDLSKGFDLYFYTSNRVNDSVFEYIKNQRMTGHESMEFKSRFENLDDELDALNRLCHDLKCDINDLFPGVKKVASAIARPSSFSFFQILMDNESYASKTAQECANFVAMYYTCKEKILYCGRDKQEIQGLYNASRLYLIDFTKEEQGRIDMEFENMIKGLNACHRSFEYQDSH